MPMTLRRGDGFKSKGTVAQMPQVERLQRALLKAGHTVDTDGLFGAGTEKAAKAFQRAHGLTVDGVVGPATWRALAPFLGARDAPKRFDAIPGFESFHGDLDWVHAREGHAGKPYWPGGRSGVTLDPGFDLGHQSIELTRQLYGGAFSDTQYQAIEAVLGLTGQRAKEALSAGTDLKGIRIGNARALEVMPHIAVRYWKPAVRRFEGAAASDTPGSVQTVILSLAYNRGARNRDLGQLAAPIARQNWLGVADLVGAMQQDHPLAGIRLRRRMEADLIRAEVELV